MNRTEQIIEEQTINDINYELLKKQFPHAVSIDKDGKYTIDPQKLQLSLDPSKANIKEDGYGLNWVGKKEAYHTAFSKNYKVLKPLNDDNSENWDNTGNILIKGDNLDALKILRHNYFEAIKMIYIDPPYNTKNDGFVYNDNFTSSTEETLEELGYDEEYVEYIENIQGAKTHSGWLSFMYPRLLLARDLLKDDGVIFISIDDNEVAQLRLLCDEVFGEDCFVGRLAWESKTKSQNTKDSFNKLQPKIEDILCYSKSKKPRFNLYLSGKKEYPEIDNNGKFRFALIEQMSAGGIRGRESMVFSINGINPELGKQWKLGVDTIDKFKKRNDIIIKDKKPYIKMRPEDERQEKYIPFWAFFDKEEGTAESAKKELSDILDNANHGFETVKPISLIIKLVYHASNKDDIILDFFAGSGTTAHAVMDLNSQDNGNRKFICVQWAEETPPKSEAKRAGYETIFDITQERIKRAGEKILGGAKAPHPKEKTLLDDIGSVALASPKLDIGFRAFEVVEDAKQKIYQKSLEEITQDDLLAFTQNTIETNEDILYNLLVADNLSLSTKIETLIEDKLFLASNVAFVLGDISIDDLIEKLQTRKELEYITIYSPNISNDKFTLELESAVGSLGIKSDKVRFRG